MARNIIFLLLCYATPTHQILPQPPKESLTPSGPTPHPKQPLIPTSGPVRSTPKCLLAPGEERMFQSLKEYQSNNISFNPNDSNYHGNEVKFSTEKFEERLEKNSFISYESNHIFGITLAQKQLRFIDDGAFLSLDCLYFLNLSLNNLTTLTRGTFLGLPNLKILNVSFNAIKNVEELDMEHLYNLDLSHNELKKLPSFTLLKSLKTLNISYNIIEEINEDVFGNMPSLEELYLDHNHLHVLELLHWKGLNSLRQLDVAYNLLNRVDIDSKFVTSNLKMLNITGNNLTALEIENIDVILKKLKILDVTNKNWRCFALYIVQTNLEQANISIRCENSSLQSASGYLNTEALGTTETSDHSGQIKHLKSHIEDLESRVKYMKYINIVLCLVVTVLAIVGVVLKFGLCRYVGGLFGRRDVEFIDDDVEEMNLVRR
ncbi:unnamed protein product [Callosobruchus maculatus]|uniref:Uncharacterized protein n=1 Tax=Callosobruchus maculatus TaxID=64391 RepID=A0A653CGE2_CALMS|nr:unnamed protein product [Callosobruchus maculatus]